MLSIRESLTVHKILLVLHPPYSNILTGGQNHLTLVCSINWKVSKREEFSGIAKNHPGGDIGMFQSRAPEMQIKLVNMFDIQVEETCSPRIL